MNPQKDEETSRWLLSKMDARPECDWRFMSNYMKAIILVTMGKEALYPDIYKETVALMVDGMLDYIFGKERRQQHGKNAL